MHFFHSFSWNDLLAIFDPNDVRGAIIWCTLSLYIVYSVLFDKAFPLRTLPSVGELHNLLVPYSLPPSKKLTLQSIAQGINSGRFHNVVVLMGAGMFFIFDFSLVIIINNLIFFRNTRRIFFVIT